MNPLEKFLLEYRLTEENRTAGKAGAVGYLEKHQFPHTLTHSRDVAEKAMELSERFGCCPQKAEIAAYFHDISAVIPNERRVEAAERFGISLYPEEKQFPLIIHQRLDRKSVV